MLPNRPALPATDPGTAHRRGTLIVLCFVQFMLVLDDTVVNVALPSMRDDLGFAVLDLAWVVNGYFLAFGGLLILGGRLADFLGRRRMFTWGVAAFGVASLLCALAQEPWQLITGRFAQGAGAAIASPAALALIIRMFPDPHERAKALGAWGAVAALGATTGLVISGVLTGLASWRWIFLINLPVAIIALVLVPRMVRESRAPRTGGRMDILGAVLGTASATCMVWGILQNAETGWGNVGSTASLLASVALAIVFLVVETRVAHPLVPPSFFRARVRLIANIATLLTSAALYAMSFLVMVHIQTVLDYDPFTAGVAYLPYGAGILVGIWLSRHSVSRLGMRVTLTTSLLVTSAGHLLLAGIESGDDYLTGLLPGLLVVSIGSGLALPALTSAALSGTGDRDAGLGSAIYTSMQQIGGAIGIATLVALASGRTETALSDGRTPVEAATDGFVLGLHSAAILLFLAAVSVLLLRTARTTKADHRHA
ncbi:MFS transporter [Microbacterium sp. MYb62]|uniref:MFS transporter n=1 Tax=Microbacterium sp. MYb62 TaxID=1848690 RepID=UPI000CFCF16E|nr:MFS transporter [Microbacterium sp. MYb62]PRB14529.1 MFS transporter [Microbacterium sp. MYb62]